MTVVLIVVIVVLAVALAGLGAQYLRHRPKRPRRVPAGSTRRILFPYVAHALSRRALDAALRLASVEDATLVPVFLARVSLDLPLDAALPHQSAVCLPMQEAIEQRAARFGVPVDARIERGRTYQHALRETIEHERFDRIVIAAATHGGPGFDADDVAWLLENAPGEIVVLRPDSDKQVQPPTLRLPRVRRSRGRRPRGPRPALPSQ
jgi:nucleotide-binding universal stress UspA family protein